MKKFKVFWKEDVCEQHWGEIEAESKEEALQVIKDTSIFEQVEEEGWEFMHTIELPYEIEVIDPEEMS